MSEDSNFPTISYSKMADMRIFYAEITLETVLGSETMYGKRPSKIVY
jgi:hypothetical protein